MTTVIWLSTLGYYYDMKHALRVFFRAINLFLGEDVLQNIWRKWWIRDEVYYETNATKGDQPVNKKAA